MGGACPRNTHADEAMGYWRRSVPTERHHDLSSRSRQPAADAQRRRRHRRASRQRDLRDGRGLCALASDVSDGRADAMVANPMSGSADYAIDTNNLTRRFGNFVAVDRVTLKIPKGQLYGFLGLNGAGKTTTIRVLTTLLPPSEGTARLWGHDVVHEPLAVRGLVGLVSDETSESQSTW